MEINNSIPQNNCGSDVFLATLTCEYCSKSLGEKNHQKQSYVKSIKLIG